MKAPYPIQVIPTVLLAALTAATFAFPLKAAAADELKPIFNGKDLTGWKVPTPNPCWRVVDGVLIGENDEELKGSLLWTEPSYGNFILELEVRWTGEIDSGILFRQPELQVQFGVSRSLKKDLTGAFYTGGPERYPAAGLATNVDRLFKPDDWNKFRLEARGNTFTVWLNGQQVSQFTSDKYAEAAPIGLQVHAKLKMKVEFRNLRAQVLN